MESIIFVILIGTIGGIFVAVQASFAGILSERLGLIENGVIVFGVGFLFALVLMILFGGGGLRNWRSIPWYVYLAGPLGIGIISAIGFSIPRIGVAPTLTLIITAQLIVGVLLDHFGWMTLARPMDMTRLIGIAILFLGSWIILR